MRDSFLSYIVQVVLRYKNDPKRDVEGSEFTRHDLAEIPRLEYSLKKLSVFGRQHGAQVSDARFVFDYALGGSDHATSETDAIYDGHLTLRQVSNGPGSEVGPIIHKISKRLHLTTHYRTTKEPRPPFPKDNMDVAAIKEYVDWLEAEPWYMPRIPGVEPEMLKAFFDGFSSWARRS